ncbi:MAG TPA: GNAT family N-acetyltransferase, partial [Candidatus Angelobacter sp.]|nr:GNAT family N-acetyltransferase [Candidatus Angelobacter sp.]
PEAFATSYEEFIQRVNPLDQLKKNFSSPDNYTFGAFDKEELIGVVTLLQEIAMKLRHRANIFAMYVTPKSRGLGAGKALLCEAINKAKSLHEVEKVNLSVVPTNKTAKTLYSSLGFKVFGKEEKALKIKDAYYDEEHMVLVLNG